MVRVLLRDLADGGGIPRELADNGDEPIMVSGSRKLGITLSRVPVEGEEIHWPNHIARIWKTMHFPNPGEGEYVACCYVVGAK